MAEPLLNIAPDVRPRILSNQTGAAACGASLAIERVNPCHLETNAVKATPSGSTAATGPTHLGPT